MSATFRPTEWGWQPRTPRWRCLARLPGHNPPNPTVNFWMKPRPTKNNAGADSHKTIPVSFKATASVTHNRTSAPFQSKHVQPQIQGQTPSALRLPTSSFRAECRRWQDRQPVVSGPTGRTFKTNPAPWWGPGKANPRPRGKAASGDFQGPWWHVFPFLRLPPTCVGVGAVLCWPPCAGWC